jgi:pimeloyl-ACP methyl ester carboxylesterase
LAITRVDEDVVKKTGKWADNLSHTGSLKRAACLWLLTVVVFAPLGTELHAQVAGADVAVSASMKHPLIPSHGNNLLSVFYLAEGSSPHPTVVLFHGFPGFEQNLDLAQALRRAGWNVLAVHYRGSWGVGGTFSFLHSVEDADATIAFLMDPKIAAQYRIDTTHIVAMGHSMGGFMAASAAAHNPGVREAILLSAWNIGAPRSSEAEEAKALAGGENLAPISGADGTTLAHEEFTHREQLDMTSLAPAISPKPVLIVTANDGSDQFATPFSAALRSAGDTRVRSVHFESDHAYSGKRLELIQCVLNFLQSE